MPSLGEGHCPETLVYLLRASAKAHDSGFFELCGRLLVGHEQTGGRWHGGHCEGIVVNLAQHFAFVRSGEVMRRFRYLCQVELWKANPRRQTVLGGPVRTRFPSEVH